MTPREILYSPVVLSLIFVTGFAIAWWRLTRPGSFVALVSSSFGRGLSLHVQTHVLLYVLAITLALSATVDGISDNFGSLTRKDWEESGWWQLAALAAKSLKPAFVAISALLVKPPLPVGSSGTNAPFGDTSKQPPLTQ